MSMFCRPPHDTILEEFETVCLGPIVTRAYGVRLHRGNLIGTFWNLDVLHLDGLRSRHNA